MAISTIFAANMTAVKKTIFLEAFYVRSVGYWFILVTLKNFWTKISFICVKNDSSVFDFETSLLQLYKCKY